MMPTNTPAAQRFWLDTFTGHNHMDPVDWDSCIALEFEVPTVVIVCSGELALEGELVDANRDSLMREPLWNLGRADIFMVPAGPIEGLRFLGTGSPGTRVVTVSLADFAQYLLKDPSARGFFESVDKWCEAFQGAFVDFNAGNLPNRKLLNQKTQTCEVWENGLFCSESGIVWFKNTGFALVGLPEGLDQPPEMMWPISSGGVFRSSAGAHLEILQTKTILRNPETIETLTAYTDYCLSQIRRKWTMAREKVLSREMKKLGQRRLEVQSARNRLINLISPRSQPAPDTDDLLLRAVYKFIYANGWQPVLPRLMDTGDRERFLQSMADASGLCLRYSKMKDEWWKEDSGVFLGFSKTGHPFVFIRRWGSYTAWDPENGKSRRVDAPFASELHSQAVYYYKSFENQKLDIWDLVSFEFASVKSEAATLLFLALIGSGLTSVLPFFTAFIINTALPGAHLHHLYIFCLAMIAVGFFKVAYEWLHEILMTRLDFRLELSSTAALWDRILHLPAMALSQYGAGDLSCRISSLLGMQTFFRTFIQVSAFQGIQIISSAAVMLWINRWLAVAGILSACLTVLFTFIFAFFQLRAFTGGEKSTGIVNSYVLELFSGIHKIRAAAAELSCYLEWSDRYGKLKSKMLASQKVGIAYGAFQAFWSTITVGLIYYIVVVLNEEGIELGAFIAFLSAYSTLSASMSALSSVGMGLGMQIPMIKFVEPLLKLVPESRSGKLLPRNLEGRLELETVTYSYPGQSSTAVSNVSLKFPAGSFVAIVGSSGCGKTSLVRMIAGLVKPGRGRIFLDDYDLSTLDRHVLRDNVAFVQQDFKLLPGTLYENIRGASLASYDDVIQAARLACVAEEIEAMPMGLHTPVGGSLSVFSGGQVQRLAIARALVRKPKVLVFDESTSALDNRVQRRIMQNLEALPVTLVFVAHRLNAIAGADQIIVMDKGNLVEKGTWSELIEKKGLFFRMVQASQGGEGQPTPPGPGPAGGGPGGPPPRPIAPKPAGGPVRPGSAQSPGGQPRPANPPQAAGTEKRSVK